MNSMLIFKIFSICHIDIYDNMEYIITKILKHQYQQKYSKSFIQIYCIYVTEKSFLFGFCPLCFDKTYQYHFFGQLVLTSHRQQGHLKTAPPFTVPYEGCAARFLHHRHRELNPGSLRGSPLHYRCTMLAPPSTVNISRNFKIINTDESLVYSGHS